MKIELTKDNKGFSFEYKVDWRDYAVLTLVFLYINYEKIVQLIEKVM